MMSLINEYLSFFDGSPFLYTLAALALLIAISWILNFIVKKILLRLVRRALKLSPIPEVGGNLIDKVIARLSNIVPATVFTHGIAWVPHLPEKVAYIVRAVAASFIILTLAMALSGVLNIVETLYNQRPIAASRPIKGYIQLLKLGIYLIAGILIIATLIDKSPIILLSGLGAMAAVLMLVFQDTLLSLVASIQISANGLVKVGDWIEVPNLNADGTVIDIALHTVKVRNFDRTITTFPTRRLITDPFKNWRGMQESGGRRIKRAIYIDQTSIHFLTEQERESLRDMPLLRDYLDAKEKEIAEWNSRFDDGKSGFPIRRRLTNVGTFRAYVERFLHNHPDIAKNDTILVRQMDPGPTGLPIEIYCYTTTTDWNEYEAIMSDIFDHLYSILHEFGLFAYQQPSGRDFGKIRMIAAEDVGHVAVMDDSIAENRRSAQNDR